MNLIHIAKANIIKNRSHTASLFIIIMIVSMLLSTGFSVMLGVGADYMRSVDRLNSMHSLFTMSRAQYLDSFEDFFKHDARVTDYNIEPAIAPDVRVTVNYGGDVELNVIMSNLDTERTISAPVITESSGSAARDRAIYLPEYARTRGYKAGDEFAMVYKNKRLSFVVAGFFDTNEFSTANDNAIRCFVPNETFEELSQLIGSSVMIAVRLANPYDSLAFNRDFCEAADIEFSSMMVDNSVIDFNSFANGSIIPIMSFSAIVVGFAFILAFISLMVIRFRVTNGIEDNLHGIGVLGAAGYTGRQIIAAFVLEYGLVALPASLLGILAAAPMFILVRMVMSSLSGIPWTLGVNVLAGAVSALSVTALLVTMVLLTCRKIKKLPPVVALRGGIAANSFRRNHFPLHGGTGSVQVRLGLKNMFAYGKLYAMNGLIIAGIALIVSFMLVIYQNFVLDFSSIVKMTGIEITDITLKVARHTDADALAAEIEKMPEVRNTSMFDWVFAKVGQQDVQGFVSNDFSRFETLGVYEGRFPEWDNEIAMPELLADELGKKMGDIVKVRVGGVTQDYIICGFYSTTNNGGHVCSLTLDGYQRLNPNYKRNSIYIYLSDGTTVEECRRLLEDKFGVVNVYKEANAGDPYAQAKARAEEKISNYLEHYDVDSVNYAVMYNGEIIMSGSSDAYQIAEITNYRDLAAAQLGTYASAVSATTQLIAVISLVIVALILSMTIKSIITKRRRELGSLKAGGFTTAELAVQLGISFIPGAVIGALIGCVCGGMLVSPFFVAVFRSSGVKNAEIAVQPAGIVAAGLLIILVTFGIAMFSAMRIRRISAYELLSE